MAACCPEVPKISVGGSSNADYHAQDTSILPGESADCYAARSGNDTGLLDDKTDYPKNKILNTEIPVHADCSVSVQFTMTPGSDSINLTWTMDQSWSGITLTPQGLLSGTFPLSAQGKPITLLVTVSDDAGVVDSRSFTFSATPSTGKNDITFVHPLPGAHVSSRFGPRVSPTTGASSNHHGVDFSVKPLPPADVLAAADGVVIFAGQGGAEGNYIKVKHLNGQGKHLCTTMYCHLDSIYVAQDQKVVAGQKIGKEGNTGVSTGPHLHFQMFLPSGMITDPLPYIRGQVKVAQATNPDNTAKGTITPQTQNGVLTPQTVDAKQNGCAAFGPDYPRDPSAPDPVDVPSSPITDPFERAWYFTMTYEVGPAWTQSSPSDPEIAAGLIETTAQQKKDGYVNTPNFPGGETKFGIAQGPNPSIKVTTMPYDPAKKTGYNNYWLNHGPADLATSKPKTAIMLFDCNYLHGNGNAASILRDANIAALSDADSAVALATARVKFMQNIVTKNPNRIKYLAGWLKRARASLAYVQSL